MVGSLRDFMQQPSGFVNLKFSNHVCKLHKVIGLKQAPHAWFSNLSHWLHSYNFTASKVDSSLFIFHTSAFYIFLLVYVDDMVVTSSLSTTIYKFLEALGYVFPIKDLGKLSFFLGIEIDYLPNGLLLSQRKYI